MEIDEAIHCMKSYLPESSTEDCTSCKYYGYKTGEEGERYCKSDEAHRMAIKALELARYTASEIMDEEMWEINHGSFAEVASRKLYKMGVVEKSGKYWAYKEDGREIRECEDCISREQALSFPFANGKYDNENASEDFILGCESYKEWLEQLPSVQPKRKRGSEAE